MIWYYRGSGFIADSCDDLQPLPVDGRAGHVPVHADHAGIAGIILTIGMAVDANVLIFERIREELRAGKIGSRGD
jgi:preprotein translocase subunit SecD